MDLSIKPLLKNNNDDNKINPNLPKPPFRMYVVGKSGFYKSNMIAYMLKNFGYLKLFKDRIFLISPTALGLDKTFEGIIPEENILDTDDKDEINEIIKTIFDVAKEENVEKKPSKLDKYFGDKKKKKKKKHFLLILDDVADVCRDLKNLYKVILKARHVNLSLIISCQTYRSLEKKARTQLSDITIGQANIKDLHELFDEFITNMSFNEFLDKYNYCFDDNIHNFLYLKLKDKNPIRKCFIEILK